MTDHVWRLKHLSNLQERIERQASGEPIQALAAVG